MVTPLTGEQLDLALLQRMHRFYEQHCARWGPWGSKYLEEGFFEALAEGYRDQVVLFSAHRGDPREPVAMSMCVHNGSQLWGRYWGSTEEIDCLHFEVCYYAPIEWAIGQGIDSFDPGAGGSHKRRRVNPRRVCSVVDKMDVPMPGLLPGLIRALPVELSGDESGVGDPVCLLFD